MIVIFIEFSFLFIDETSKYTHTHTSQYCSLIEHSSTLNKHSCWRLCSWCHTNSVRQVEKSESDVPNCLFSFRLALIHMFSTLFVLMSGCTGSTKLTWCRTTSVFLQLQFQPVSVKLMHCFQLVLWIAHMYTGSQNV